MKFIKLAAHYGYAKKVYELLEHNVNINFQDGNEQTALMHGIHKCLMRITNNIFI